MPDIFLSYNREDQATARRFAEGFEAHGLSVWWDQTLRSGEAYDQVTEKALEIAKAVVVLWSKRSVDSRWVRAEATQADRNKTLVPVMIEPCKRPIMFELTHTADLSHWNGDANDKAWQTFLSDVRRFVNKGEPIPAAQPVAKQSKRIGGLAIGIAVAALLAAGSLLWMLGRKSGEHQAPATAAEVTLAVLPFADMSPAHDQEYFSDGLSEEILNQLAQIRSLRVTGRTSSFSFKGKNEDLRVIGEKLGVANLLEGSIRKDGNQLRITAQLIKSKDGTHLWSQTYDRELSKVFALQEEIAKDVARALSIALDVGEMTRAKGGTISVEAYDQYLRAAALADSFTPKELTQSIQFYRESVALDPAFARAWYGLFGTLQKTLLAIPENAVATRSEMVEVSTRVVALAPDAWWTQSMRAEQFRQLHKWAEDEAAVSRAVATAPPTEFAATQVYLLFLWAVGRANEAAAYMERAHQADPLSHSNSLLLQNALELAGRRAEAQAEYARAKDIGFSDASLDFLALMRLWSRKDADPVAIRTQFRTLLQHDAGRMRIHGSLADKLDNKESARATLRQAFEDPANQNGTSMLAVALYADHFGDKDLALAALRGSMVDLRSLAIGYIWFPYESGLRTDPRFKEILRDMGLVDYFRTSGNWGDFCKPIGKDDFECH